ncbi:MAG TPA: hypothetical protein VFU36_08000, partial [Jatrophihabitans sp.]|nr:hypothetical protein [Jatrophihabitans sp.]
ARTVVVALGSVLGTLADVADEFDGAVGVLGLTLFRPFPAARVRAMLSEAEHVIVLERAFAPGAGGVVAADVRSALAGLPIPVTTVVAGLGGRAVTRAALRGMLTDAAAGELADLTFLDLRTDVVARELTHRRPSPVGDAR